MERLIECFHKNQLRNYRPDYLPAKIPYTDHLVGVRTVLETALRKFNEVTDPQLLQDMCDAALGHDLLEDTDATEENILKAANPRVLKLIRELTNPDDDEHTARYMDQLSAASEEARLIKYADLIENTTCVCFNYHILGEKWVDTFYQPILSRTAWVLGKTEFPTYPKTAEFLRDLLLVYTNLLYKKGSTNPWQYPVRILESAREAISEKDLTENINRFTEECRKICGRYKKGFLTDTEIQRELDYLTFNYFTVFLKEHRVYTAFTAANRADFLRDYRQWAEKNLTSEEADFRPFAGEDEASSAVPETIPWLCLIKENVYGGTEYAEEASPQDKAAFFTLMQAFCLDPDHYEPLPKGAAAPAVLASGEGSWDFRMGGNNVWQDDGGLLSETFSLGDTIVLTDRYGLKAKIQVKEAVPKEEIPQREADFIGTGFVEGYTTERPREIRIRLTDRRPIFLEFAMDADDYAHFRNYPLWKEWQELTDRKYYQHILSREKIIEKYSKKTEA